MPVVISTKMSRVADAQIRENQRKRNVLSAHSFQQNYLTGLISESAPQIAPRGTFLSSTTLSAAIHIIPFQLAEELISSLHQFHQPLALR